MYETSTTARIFKVNNIHPTIDKEEKKRREQEALRTMHEIYSRQNQGKKA